MSKSGMFAHLLPLAVLFIAFVSLSPIAKAQFDCATCGSADPFQPLNFILSTAMFALTFWIVLSPRAKRYRTFIYQYITFAGDNSKGFVRKLVATGLLLSSLSIIPAVAAGPEGGGGIGGGATTNPFAAFEFLAQVVVYSVSIMALLNPRRTKTVSARTYGALRILSASLYSCLSRPRELPESQVKIQT